MRTLLVVHDLSAEDSEEPTPRAAERLPPQNYPFHYTDDKQFLLKLIDGRFNYGVNTIYPVFIIHINFDIRWNSVFNIISIG